MPSRFLIASGHNSTLIVIPLSTNTSTDTKWSIINQIVCHGQTIIHIDIWIDFPIRTSCYFSIITAALFCCIRIESLKRNTETNWIITNRIKISTTTSSISWLHSRQAINHLLLGKIKNKVMILHEVALNFSNTWECPAWTTTTLISDWPAVSRASRSTHRVVNAKYRGNDRI